MEKNVTKIIDHLITTADLICLDTSEGGFPKDISEANVIRFCLGQQDDEDNDKKAGGILREHGLNVWDLRFLDKQGVLVNEEQPDAPGSIIDDRTLHVSVWKKDVLKVASLDVVKWKVW